MRQHLLFTIYGPMQAWGKVAVGEVRPVESRPTRSGLLGLLAASLGIRRGDPVLDALNRECRVAVRQDRPGSLMTDYHTAQVPKESKGRVFSTRRQELVTKLDRDERPNTVISNREYLADAAFTACIWLEGAQECSLEGFRDALKRPRLTPYLGRKSCPAACPFMPEIVEAQDELEAFEVYEPEEYCEDIYKLGNGAIWTEGDHGRFNAFTVRDRVIDHQKRQFGTRFEYHVPPQGAGED